MWKVIRVLIPNTVIEVPKAQHGLGAGLPGVGHIPDHTHGHIASVAHIQGPGLHHLDLIHEIDLVIIHGVVDHHLTLLLAVMIEDEPRGNLDPVGKNTLQIKGTAAALRRHAAVDIPDAETSHHGRENIAKVGHP